MYSGKKGLRCQVCTGCGLCPGVIPEGSAAGEIHVIAEDGFEGQCLSAGNTGKSSGNGDDGNADSRNCDRRLAVADVGTTTIAMLLYGADGAVADRYVSVNPQTVFGADVISRIRAAENCEKAEELTGMVRGVLEQGLARFRKQLAEGESLQLVLAANTTMTYFLMGWDTSELGCAPFRASRLSAAETDISGVSCFVFPGQSAFVGGDITAGMLACGMAEREEITLLVDLGTNGEIVLGNRDRRIACATAAGPAFEGGVNRGIWGADMVHFLAVLRREGLLDVTGLLAEPYFEKGIRIGNVTVTQKAVRSVQLAKAAIAAGIEILLEKYGLRAEQVERVVLAGGFGYYLKPEDAGEIGLLPKELAKKAVAGGNTALFGAKLAGAELIDHEDGQMAVMQRLEKLKEGTECINLAQESDFGERYMRRMELS